MTTGQKILMVFGSLGVGYCLFRLTDSSTQEDTQFQKSAKESGKMYGYPDCCIKAFIKHTPSYLKRNDPTSDNRMQYEASFHKGEYSGFIPCPKHAKMILNGEISLESLIQNRHSSLQKFPIDWTLK